MSKALQFGGGCYVPQSVAKCPECGGELVARSMQWDVGTGRPHAEAIEIDCIDYLSHHHGHNWHQSSWQPIRDAIAKWGNAVSYSARGGDWCSDKPGVT